MRRFRLILAVGSLVVAAIACEKDPVPPPPPPEGTYALVSYLGQPLPVQATRRMTPEGVSCADTLRSGSATLRDDGVLMRRWLGEERCVDGSGAGAYDRRQFGEVTRLSDGRLVVTNPLAGLADARDTLVASGSRLVWVLTVQRVTEHGTSGVDTMTIVWERER